MAGKTVGAQGLDLKTVEELVALRPDKLTRHLVRRQIRDRVTNGLASAVVPLGRRLLVSERGYQRWLESQAGHV